MSKVAIIMGSKSDEEIMKQACEVLKGEKIEYEMIIASAHRDPEKATEFARNASKNGFDVIIAGAGLAAHLPGFIASKTDLPVIGVPLNKSSLGGLDSLLSIVQMPAGVPVATVGIDNAKNAAYLALRILNIKKRFAKKVVSSSCERHSKK